jgi:flavin reductase (DIM6/NTAB) family NADH-FMN oxidoreductase RutF
MKEKLGQITPSYPMPVAIVGTTVEGVPNFLTVAWFSMVSYKPPMIAVVLDSHHYSNKGIKETKSFSVCIPSESMVKVTDYIGIYSGKKKDKSNLFKLFYGETKAPMIQDCSVCIECELDKVDINGANEMFVGKIVEVYADKEVLTDEKIDLKKVNPMLLSQGDRQYYKLGEKFESAWKIGQEFDKK